MEEQVERAFKGVWIPAAIWETESLTWLEKCLLAEIDSLDRGDGCFASNAYLAMRFGKSEKHMANTISDLRKQGWIIDRSFDGRTRKISSAIRGDGKPNVKADFPEKGKADFPEKGNDTYKRKEERTEAVRFFKKNGEEIPLSTGDTYQADGWSPKQRLDLKRKIERSIGIGRSTKWTQLLLGSAWDFKKAFLFYEGYEYPDTIVVDEVAKTLAKWYELGETRETVKEMMIAFFEGSKAKAVTITPNSVFSSHTYNSWKQGKL